MFNHTKLFCIFCFHLLCLYLSPCHANSIKSDQNFVANMPWYSLFIQENLILNSKFYSSNFENINAELLSNQKMSLYPETKELVCEFPARYFENSLDKQKAQAELKQCADFQKFVLMIQRNYISLSLTSENIQSTSTATGHLFLTLHNNATPELDSHVISFFAHQDESDSFIPYAYKGIMGQYPGFFHLDPLFQKQFEYSEAENRFIYHYQLKMNDEQKFLFYAIIYELKKAKLKYYFFNFNCSQQIDYILSHIFQKNHLDTHFFVLPIDIVKHHQNQFNNVTMTQPLKHQAYQAIKNLNSSDKNNLQNFLNRKVTFSSLNEPTKNAAAHYLKYDFRSNQKKYSDLAQQLDNFVATKSFENDLTIPNPLQTPDRSRMQLNFELNSQNPVYELSYRPLLVDHYDLRQLFWSQSNLSIFTTKIQTQDNQFKLQQFDIIQIQGLTDYSRFFSDLSWNLYSGWNRKNLSSHLLFENHLGIGQTFFMFNQVTFFYSFGLGFEFNDQNKNGFIFGLQQIKWNLSDKLFLHTEVQLKKYSNQSYDFSNLGLAYNFKENTYGIQFKKDANLNRVSSFLSLQHYF